MPRWHVTPDYDFEPASPPAARDGAAYVTSAGRLWVLGGYDAAYAFTSTVYSYEPNSNTWETHDPLSVAVAAYASAAQVGDWFYIEAFDNANDYFLRYNPATGVTEALTHNGTVLFQPLAAVGGLVYTGLSFPTPRVYNPQTSTWSDVPGGSPYASQIGSPAVGVLDGSIIIAGGGDPPIATARRYEPNANRWTDLPDLPTAIGMPHLTTYRGRLVLSTGYLNFSTFENNDRVFALSHDATEWEELETSPHAVGGASVGNPLGRVIAVGGWETDEGGVFAGSMMFGEPPALLDAQLDVGENDARAFLPVSFDVTGGPGTSELLLVLVNVSREARASLIVRFSVQDDEATETLPTPVAGGGVTILPPGSATARKHEAIPGCDQYSFTSALGAGTTGAATKYHDESGSPTASFIPGLDNTGDPQAAWQRDADVTITTDYPNATIRALEETVLDELVPDPSALEAIANGRAIPPALEANGPPIPPALTAGSTGLFSMDAPLCADAGLTLCGPFGVRGDLKQALRASRPPALGIAQQAASAAGVTLSVIPGVGAPGVGLPLPENYTTVGKTSMQVLRETALLGGALYAFEPMALIVDGRGLPDGSGYAHPDVHAPGGGFTDGGAWTGDIRIERQSAQNGAASPDPSGDPVEPDLADYLAECEALEETADSRSFSSGGGTDTFETRPNARLTWVERSGGGYDYRETTHTIEKKNGRLRLEERAVRGWRRIPNGWQYTLLEESSAENWYLACCPDALTRTLEVVRVAKTFDQAPGVDEAGTQSDEAITWWNLMPNTYLQSRREVRQRWHAEGWLRSRSETSRAFDGFEFRETVITNPLGSEATQRVARTTYVQNSREEKNTPIGRGMWHQAVHTSDTILVPIREQSSRTVDGETILVNEIVGSTRSIATNSYLVVTDQAPPTVSCGEANPCADPDDPVGACEDEKAAEFERDHEAWQREVALRAAERVNDPQEKLVQSFSWQEHLPGVRVGQLVLTTRGLGLVARVSWDGNGPRAGEPARGTSAEVWSRVSAP